MTNGPLFCVLWSVYKKEKTLEVLLWKTLVDPVTCSTLSAWQAPASEGPRVISSLSYMENSNGSTLVFMPKWPLLSTLEGISRTTRKSQMKKTSSWITILNSSLHEDYEKLRMGCHSTPLPKEREREKKMKSPEAAQFCQPGLAKCDEFLFSRFLGHLVSRIFLLSLKRKGKAQKFCTSAFRDLYSRYLKVLVVVPSLKRKTVTIFYVSQKQRRARNSWRILKCKNPVVSLGVNIFHSLKNWVS